MRRTLTLVSCLLLLGGAGAAAGQTEDTSSPALRIAWEDFKKLYDSKDVVVIDVRSGDAFEAGHIPGSRSVPLDQVAQQADALKKLKKPIVVYCA